MTVIILWLFLALPRVGMQCLIVVFSDNTYFSYCMQLYSFKGIISLKHEIHTKYEIGENCVKCTNNEFCAKLHRLIVVWLFLTMPWVSLQFVIVVFPDHTHYF